MPVILNGSDAEAAWLDPDVDLEGALELVRPLPAGLLEVYPVSARVNNPRNQRVELDEPLHRAICRDERREPRSYYRLEGTTSGACSSSITVDHARAGHEWRDRRRARERCR
jgi:SOS response associated peptidase (SRAP)